MEGRGDRGGSSVVKERRYTEREYAVDTVKRFSGMKDDVRTPDLAVPYLKRDSDRACKEGKEVRSVVCLGGLRRHRLLTRLRCLNDR